MEHFLRINTLNHHYLLLSLTSSHKELEEDAVWQGYNERSVCVDGGRRHHTLLSEFNKPRLILIYILQFIVACTATFMRTEREIHQKIRFFNLLYLFLKHIVPLSADRTWTDKPTTPACQHEAVCVCDTWSTHTSHTCVKELGVCCYLTDVSILSWCSCWRQLSCCLHPSVNKVLSKKTLKFYVLTSYIIFN